MKAEAWKAIASIVGITIVATTALLVGINGIVFFLAISALAGIGGYAVRGIKHP